MVEIITASVVCIVLLAEWLHARRCRKMALLAFGPRKMPTEIARIMSLCRIGAAGLLCWGFAALHSLPTQARSSVKTASPTHLVFALDVSPSMNLVDSGMDGKLTRARRARDVIQSILERLDLTRVKVSIIAFYTGSRPVAVDVVDQEVIANILDDLPLDLAFENGKTDLFSSLEGAGKIAGEWQPGSARLFVLSDGDTLSETLVASLPRAYSKTYILGLGSPYKGSYIDGHSSRQFQNELQRLAMKADAVFWDANQKHLPSTMLPELPGVEKNVLGDKKDFRARALWAIALGICLMGVVSPALALLGRSYPPRSTKRRRVRI